MKKFLGIVLLGLLIFNFASAETWNCIYQFEGEARTNVVKRVGWHFTSIYDDNTHGGKIKIVKETEKFIHLYENIDPFETAFLTVLNKEKSSFVMVGLESGNSTDIIEGKCIVK